MLGTQAQIADVIASGRARFSDARLGGEPLRLYRAPLADRRLGAGRRRGRLRGDRTRRPTSATPITCASSSLVAGAAAALLAIAIALLLTRRALRPLTDLSAAARAIGETGDATRRLPPTGAGDEVGALSETLNAMLASLERAREAERRFVADASHELRTPLTALRGNAAYIAQHGADAEVLADLEADAERLSRLLDDLLALAREDAAGPGPGEAVRLDRLALELAGTASRCTPQPRSRCSAMLRRWRGRSRNLIENGLVHGPAGGLVVDRPSARAQAALSSRVSDSGPGLSPEEARARVRALLARARGRRAAGLGARPRDRAGDGGAARWQRLCRGLRVHARAPTLPLSESSQAAPG